MKIERCIQVRNAQKIQDIVEIEVSKNLSSLQLSLFGNSRINIIEVRIIFIYLYVLRWEFEFSRQLSML